MLVRGIENLDMQFATFCSNHLAKMLVIAKIVRVDLAQVVGVEHLGVVAVAVVAAVAVAVALVAVVEAATVVVEVQLNQKKYKTF